MAAKYINWVIQRDWVISKSGTLNSHQLQGLIVLFTAAGVSIHPSLVEMMNEVADAVVLTSYGVALLGYAGRNKELMVQHGVKPPDIEVTYEEVIEAITEVIKSNKIEYA